MTLLARVEPAPPLPPLMPELTERLARRVAAHPNPESVTVSALGAGTPIAELPRSTQRDVPGAVHRAGQCPV